MQLIRLSVLFIFFIVFLPGQTANPVDPQLWATYKAKPIKLSLYDYLQAWNENMQHGTAWYPSIESRISVHWCNAD